MFVDNAPDSNANPGETPAEDEKLFETEIPEAKQTAVFDKIESGEAGTDEAVEERLADLGYM